MATPVSVTISRDPVSPSASPTCDDNSTSSPSSLPSSVKQSTSPSSSPDNSPASAVSISQSSLYSTTLFYLIGVLGVVSLLVVVLNKKYYPQSEPLIVGVLYICFIDIISDMFFAITVRESEDLLLRSLFPYCLTFIFLPLAANILRVSVALAATPPNQQVLCSLGHEKPSVPNPPRLSLEPQLRAWPVRGVADVRLIGSLRALDRGRTLCDEAGWPSL